MLLHCDSTVLFDYVLNDSWYSSAENMAYIKRELKQNFIMAIKYNRKVALSKQEKQEKKYRGISSLEAAMKQRNELSTPLSKRYSCARVHCVW
jgi:hypothetical protein